MIRYPGSKDKIWRFVWSHFPDWLTKPLWARENVIYCEPFFGSGAIGRKIMSSYPVNKLRVSINDIDPGVAAVWICVKDSPRDLIRLINKFTPSVEAFQKFKASDGVPNKPTLQQAFEKIVLHQTSFSGLGFKAGGPIGGIKQRSDYNVDCRWNPARLSSAIKKTHRLFKRMLDVSVTSADYSLCLQGLGDCDFAYLDPPYYLQGPSLYKFGMGDHSEHLRLASILRAAPFDWVLSYDNHEMVRDLYSWAEVIPFEVVNTISTVERKQRERKNSELLIRPRRNSQGRP